MAGEEAGLTSASETDPRLAQHLDRFMEDSITDGTGIFTKDLVTLGFIAPPPSTASRFIPDSITAASTEGLEFTTAADLDAAGRYEVKKSDSAHLPELRKAGQTIGPSGLKSSKLTSPCTKPSSCRPTDNTSRIDESQSVQIADGFVSCTFSFCTFACKASSSLSL